MNKRLDDIEQELKNINVTKDMFDLWKQNDVTRMFLLDLEGLFLETQAQPSYGQTIEQIAIQEIKRSTRADVIEEILEWNPTDSE